MVKYVLGFKRKMNGEGVVTPSETDLVKLRILTKQVSEFTNSDIGTEVSIPYTNEGSGISGPIIFKVVGVNHHKDTNNEETPTITLMTKNIIRLAAFDAAEPDNTNSTRQSNGNNRWSVSNIRQWLNSSGAAGSWFTAQHSADVAPTYASEPGFLAGFGANILQHFTDITNTTVLNSVDGGGSETTVDKVFLPSHTEIGYGNNNGIAEGSQLSKFTDDNSRIKQWDGSNYQYWTRSLYSFPMSGGPAQVYFVRDDGTYQANRAPAISNYGIAPIIVLH